MPLSDVGPYADACCAHFQRQHMVTSSERPWDVVMEKMLSLPKKKWCSERTKENRTSAGIAEDD